MDKSNARIILGAEGRSNTKEELIEFYEEAVFEQASFFMRRTFHPILAKARIEKLKKIREAADCFKIPVKESIFHPDLLPNEFADSVLESVKAYQLVETKLKKMLSKALCATRVIEIYEIWIEVFLGYANNYIRGYEGSVGVVEHSGVKMSEQINTGELLLELEKEKYDGLGLLEYGRLKKTIG